MNSTSEPLSSPLMIPEDKLKVPHPSSPSCAVTAALIPVTNSPLPASNIPPSSQLLIINPPPPASITPPTSQISNSSLVVSISPSLNVNSHTSSQPPVVEACDIRVPSSPINHQSTSNQIDAPSQFVPSLGSWAKPLIFKPAITPPDPSTPSGYDRVLVGNQLAALWPSLNDEILNKQLKSKHPTRSLQLPVEKLPPPELKADGSLRFPWAARLGPHSRNLFRATSPSYRIDGTPEVSIPSKVLKLGPENKDEYVIGKFHKCSLPPGGLIHAVVNKIWGRSCKISCKKLSDSSYMFHIPHQPTRQWIIQRGVWHVDDCLLFVLPWTPEGSFKIPEISTLPVWVNLKDIPDSCYSRLGISHVASGLGEPILTHKPRLDPTNMGEAKVLVEMELDRDFPKLIALDDKQGSIFLVKVEYTWIPSTCERCGSLGHKAKRCLLPPKSPENKNLSSDLVSPRAEIPIVDIDIIPQQNENVVLSSSPIQHQVLTGQGSLTGQRSLPATNSAYEAPRIQNQSKELDGLFAPEQELHIITKPVPSPSSDSIPDHEPLYVDAHASTERQDTPAARYTTNFSSSKTQQEDQTALPTLFNTTSPLADSPSAPTTTHIMEFSPSNNINSEVPKTSFVDHLDTKTQGSAFESPSSFTTLGLVDEAEPSSSLGLTRGGRETKPPTKYQDLEWKTVQGRGKHGRRGRGSNR
ncbi:hypothetical protein N665_2625s0004 [Sinapis alba]|nr:hypothetical protein N665_2625s0004 [Sinapis alba]